MLTPTRSAGSRSGVNWTRFHVQSIDAASALARLVLPTPGTSSMSRWPSASRHITASSIGSILPCTTWAMFAVMASNSEAKREFGASESGSSPPAARLGVTVTRDRVDARRRLGAVPQRDRRRPATRYGRARADLPGDRRRHRPAGGRRRRRGGRGRRARPGGHAAARRVAGAAPARPPGRRRPARTTPSRWRSAASAARVRSTASAAR